MMINVLSLVVSHQKWLIWVTLERKTQSDVSALRNIIYRFTLFILETVVVQNGLKYSVFTITRPFSTGFHGNLLFCERLGTVTSIYYGCFPASLGRLQD